MSRKSKNYETLQISPQRQMFLFLWISLFCVLFFCVLFDSVYSSCACSHNLGIAQKRANDHTGNCIVVFASKPCWCYLVGPMRNGCVNQPKNGQSSGRFGASQTHSFTAVWASRGGKLQEQTNCSSGARHNFNQAFFIFSGRIHSEQEIKEMPRACSEQWQWVRLPTGPAEMHWTEMVHHKRAL